MGTSSSLSSVFLSAADNLLHKQTIPEQMCLEINQFYFGDAFFYIYIKALFQSCCTFYTPYIHVTAAF